MARQLARLFVETLLVGGDPERDWPGRRVAVAGDRDDLLTGVVAALEQAHSKRVLVVEADGPLPETERLLALVAAPDAAVVVAGARGATRPLRALLDRDACLVPARSQVACGASSMAALLEQVGSLSISLAPPAD